MATNEASIPAEVAAMIAQDAIGLFLEDLDRNDALPDSLGLRWNVGGTLRGPQAWVDAIDRAVLEVVEGVTADIPTAALTAPSPEAE